jgi:alanine dehydrogenase
MVLLLTEADLQTALAPDALVDAMAAALARFSRGEVVQPLRTVIELGAQGWLYVMPAFVPPGGGDESPPSRQDDAAASAARGSLGAKLVTVIEANAARGLPTHLATVLLLDHETGALVAVMDGRYLTEVRTAAVSAVSVRHLARADQPLVMALLGTGVQARAHARLLPRIRPLREIRIWSPTPAHRARFVAEIEPEIGVPVRETTSPAAAATDADLIVTATTARRPVVSSEWVKPGAHVIAVGAPRPDQRELDPALLARARVIVDARASALVEAGDIVQAIAEGYIGPDHIAGELGEVVLGRIPGRTAPEQITVFKSLGLAVEDLVAARLAYDAARRAGIGSPVPWPGESRRGKAPRIE